MKKVNSAIKGGSGATTAVIAVSLVARALAVTGAPFYATTAAAFPPALAVGALVGIAVWMYKSN